MGRTIDYIANGRTIRSFLQGFINLRKVKLKKKVSKQ